MTIVATSPALSDTHAVHVFVHVFCACFLCMFFLHVFLQICCKFFCIFFSVLQVKSVGKDKRNMYLSKEGMIGEGSPAWTGMSSQDQ